MSLLILAVSLWTQAPLVQAQLIRTGGGSGCTSSSVPGSAASAFRALSAPPASLGAPSFGSAPAWVRSVHAPRPLFFGGAPAHQGGLIAPAATSSQASGPYLINNTAYYFYNGVYYPAGPVAPAPVAPVVPLTPMTAAATIQPQTAPSQPSIIYYIGSKPKPPIQAGQSPTTLPPPVILPPKDVEGMAVAADQ